MGQKIDPVQNTYSGGELDPQLIARSDSDAYYSGCERARNVLLIPHGGATRRPGLRHVAVLPPVVERIDLSSGVTVTAPNGGTAANAVDGDSTTKVTTTTQIQEIDGYVVLHVDLGSSAPAILFADVRNIYLSGSFLNLKSEVRIQHSDNNSTWTDFGEGFDNLSTDENRANSDQGQWNYRRANPAGAVTHRYWRVVRIGSTDADARVFNLGEFRLWRAVSPATISACRQIQFKISSGLSYHLLVSDQNIRVFRDNAYQADIYIPHTTDQLPALTWAPSEDTLLLFHEEVPTHRIERQAVDDEWVDFLHKFTSIPQRNFADLTNPGGGDEDVFSETRGYPRCGAFFGGRLWVAGTSSLPKTAFGSAAKGDFFDMQIPDDPEADDALEVTFDADEQAAIFHLEAADFLFAITSAGPFFFLPREEPITGDNVSVPQVRGKHGALGPGLRAFQLDEGIIYLSESGETMNEIREETFRGRFTVSNLAFLAPHLIRDPQDITLRRRLSTNRGDLTLVVNSDGSLAVLQSLRERDFTGWAGWHAAKGSEDDANLQGRFISVGVDVDRFYAVVERTINGEVQRCLEEFRDDHLLDASTRVIATSDTFTASTAGQGAYVYTFTSPAEAASMTVRHNEALLEEADYTVDLPSKTVMLSATKAAEVARGDKIRISIKIEEITGLEHLEGETLRTYCDGAVGNDVAVSGGSVTFTEVIDQACEVGLFWPDVKEILVEELITRQGLTEEEARKQIFAAEDGAGEGDGLLIRDMPADFPPDSSVPTLRGREKRVYEVVLTVHDTQNFYLAANNRSARPFEFGQFGDFLLDRAPPRESRQIRLRGIKGYSQDGQTEITQRDPGPLTVLSVARGISVS